MNRRPTATATLDLNLGAHTPEGVLTDRQGRVRRFSGWIELAGAIEDWRIASSRAVPAVAQDPTNEDETCAT
jgi:hypothetical protein